MIMSMKNSSDTTENQCRNLPACTAVPQPTAPVAENLTWIHIDSMCCICYVNSSQYTVLTLNDMQQKVA